MTTINPKAKRCTDRNSTTKSTAALRVGGSALVTHTRKQEVWGYCRVSTDQQTNENQEHSILKWANAHGLKIARFVRCAVSTRRTENERGLDELKHAAERRSVSTIVFAELSRLGRSVGEIARLVSHFTSNGVSLVFIKEGMTLGSEASRDLTSKVTLTIFSLLAEIERHLISERTKCALAARKAAGVRLGRPALKSKLDQHETQIREWLALGVRQNAIARHVSCTQCTLSTWLKRKRSQWEAHHETALQKGDCPSGLVHS